MTQSHACMTIGNVVNVIFIKINIEGKAHAGNATQNIHPPLIIIK